MTASGMKPQTVAEIVALMKLQYQFARTGEGWDEYAAARTKLAARMGRPPDAFPGHARPSLLAIHPAVVLLRSCSDAPSAPDAGAGDLRRAGQQHPRGEEQGGVGGGVEGRRARDYTLRILPKANHYQWEAKAGNNAEMMSLQRFVPEYFADHPGLARHTDSQASTRQRSGRRRPLRRRGHSA